MPNIRTFENNVKAPVADQAGSEAYEQLGRHEGESYALAGQAINRGLNEIGQQITDHEDTTETLELSKQFAQLDAQTDQELQQMKTSADPNDPQLYQKYMEQKQNTIDQLGANLDSEGGKRLYAEYANRYAMNTMDKITSWQSQAAAEKGKNDLEDTGTLFANGATADPTTVLSKIADLQALQTHLDPAWGPAVVRQQITKVADAGAESVIGKVDGLSAPTTEQIEATKKFLNDPKNGFQNASPGKIEEINNRLSEMEKNQGANQRAKIDFDERQGTIAAGQAVARVANSIYNKDGSVNPAAIPQALSDAAQLQTHYPMATLADINGLRGAIKNAQLGKFMTDDPNTVASLRQGIIDGTVGPQQIMQQNFNENLSNQTTAKLVSDANEYARNAPLKAAMQDFTTFTNAQKPAFVHVDPMGMIGTDPHSVQGAAQWAGVDVKAKQIYENTFTTQGPEAARALLDPSNKNYLGKLYAAQSLYQKAAMPAATVSGPPKAGTIVSGYKYVGGDPSKPASWAKVQ